jgi:pimeloyl-ACP methyl ester carboxylesterase
MATFVEDTVALLERLNAAPAHVYGMSFGGMVAQELALTHREAVRSLVLAATRPGGGPPVQRDISSVPKARPWLAMYSEGFASAHPGHVADDLRHRSRHMPQARRRQWEAMQEWRSWDRLPALRVPTLVIHGTGDRVVPVAYGRQLAERIPGAELVLLEGAGHLYYSEQPEASDRAVLGFLDRVDGRELAAG